MSGSLPGKKSMLLRWSVVSGIFVLVMLLLSVLLLKRGVSVDRLDIGTLVLLETSLVWQEKLELRVASLVVEDVTEGPKSVFDAESLEKAIGAVSRIVPMFSLIELDRLKYGAHSGSVRLHQRASREYLLDVTTDEAVLRSLVRFEKSLVSCEIVDADIAAFRSSGSGHVTFNTESVQADGTLNLVINDGFPVSLTFTADRKGVSFKGKEAGQIDDIVPLVDLFGLSHNIERWITDYLDGSRYQLKSFHGSFPWGAPVTLLDTLEAEVKVDDTEYVFAPGLEPIKAEYTDVTFSRGVLDIKPHNSTFYGQDGGDSWLDIDFNDPANIMLTAYIVTEAIANDDIIALLNHYDIPLPLKQTGGITAVDLTLKINLNEEIVDVEAAFEIPEGTILYGAREYQVKEAKIGLKNSSVTITHLKVRDGELFSGEVSGEIDVGKGLGSLVILPEQMSIPLGNSTLHLDRSFPAPLITCHLLPGGQILEAEPTSWRLDTFALRLGGFRAPVDYKTLSVDLPEVMLEAPDGIQVELQGFLSVKEKRVDLACELRKYDIGDLVLETIPLPLTVRYDGKLEVIASQTADLLLNKVPLKIYPSRFQYGERGLTAVGSRLSYGSFFDSSFSGHYSIKDKKGEFFLSKIDITDENLDNDLEIGSEIHVELSGEKQSFEVRIPEVGLRITTDKEKNWSAVFSDLSRVFSRSRILQQYGIKEGSLQVTSQSGTRPYHFSALLKAPEPFLVDSEGPDPWLDIVGRITDHGIFTTINNDVDIEYADGRLNLVSYRHGYNIPAIISFLKTRIEPSAQEGGQNSGMSVSLHAENSFLYIGPKSRMLGHRIDLHYGNGILDMTLSHGSGQVLLRMEGDSFRASGRELNDMFMGALIHTATFTGGRMSFSAVGDFSDFSVIFEIDDALLKDLKTLNNAMAMLNTIPALITFSLPEYSIKGLYLDSAVVGMNYKEKIATFESIDVKSSEIRAAGNGWIDFAKRWLDLDIYLTTQARRNVRKIPIIGYVVAGKEEESSVSLKISGDLDDPKVDVALLREIIAIPYELIYRTLHLPSHLFETLKGVAK